MTAGSDRKVSGPKVLGKLVDCRLLEGGDPGWPLIGGGATDDGGAGTAAGGAVRVAAEAVRVGGDGFSTMRIGSRSAASAITRAGPGGSGGFLSAETEIRGLVALEVEVRGWGTLAVGG